MAADRPSRKMRPTAIVLTADQHRDLRSLADKKLSTVSQVVRQLVQEAVEREKRDDAHTHAR